MPAVLTIILAETVLEKRLFEEGDVDQVDSKESDSPKGMRSGPEEHRLRREDEEHC
jgi:hypothetical protein